MSFSLEQYEAKVLKRNSWRNKFIRVLLINKKPIMQTRNNRTQTVKENDISEVAGVFICFSSPNDEIILKLFKKRRTIEVKFSDEKDFESFKNQIETILDDFHEGKESRCSINNNRRTNYSSKMSSGFESMNITNSTDLEYEDAEMTGYIDSKDITVRDSRENIYQKIFEENYPVKQFNSKIRPLQGGFEELEKSLERIKHTIDFNLFICMKLREEISHEGGVKIEIDEKYIDDFSVKSINKEIWISNIFNPKIAENLHIGDRIMLTNGKAVTDKFSYQQQVKQHEINTLIIQRLPKAKVFSINQSNSNKNITFKNKNYRYQMSLNGKKEKWWITEVNNQNTINIYSDSIDFKKEFSTLVVQPFEFIKSLIDLTP